MSRPSRWWKRFCLDGQSFETNERCEESYHSFMSCLDYHPRARDCTERKRWMEIWAFVHESGTYRSAELGMVASTYVYEDVCDRPLLIRRRQNYTQRCWDGEIKQQVISNNLCSPDQRREVRHGRIRHGRWEGRRGEDRQRKGGQERTENRSDENMREEDRRNKDSWQTKKKGRETSSRKQ